MGSAIPGFKRRLFASLASRIGFFVFAATLGSALAVAGTSALALRSLLRSKIEDQVPEAASRARDRLELWFAQRTLEVEVFAHSDIVTGGLSHVGARATTPDDHQRSEVEQYLRYVREDLPVYTAIFALDRQGSELVHVGSPQRFDSSAVARLAAVDRVAVSGVLLTHGGERVQVVSAPVRLHEGAGIASLHAVLPLSALREQLAMAARDETARLHVFDPHGLVASSLEDELVELDLDPKLTSAPEGSMVEYSAADGVRVVASALPFPRLHGRIVFEGDYGTTFAPIASILRRMVGMNLGIVLVLTALAFAIARYLLRPLHALSDCAMRLRDGEPNVSLPVVASDDEVGILTRSFSEMVESLTRANETLEQLAITDGLTKIHNHRFFQDRLEVEIRRSEASGAPLALILLDIDDFKALNDRHGHASGDEVLTGLARVLSTRAREGDLVARYGGEEFVLLAPDTSLEAALALAEQVRIAIHDHTFRSTATGAEMRVTVSVGLAAYRGDRRRFFADADRALYAAKHAGKDCVMAVQDA